MDDLINDYKEIIKIFPILKLNFIIKNKKKEVSDIIWNEIHN